jgi:hypothetical protein
VVLSNLGVGAVYALVGSVALLAIFVLALFGLETRALSLEQSSRELTESNETVGVA